MRDRSLSCRQSLHHVLADQSIGHCASRYDCYEYAERDAELGRQSYSGSLCLLKVSDGGGAWRRYSDRITFH